MYEESKAMKMIRSVRNKHYEETKGMNAKQLLNFYKQGAQQLDKAIAKSPKAKA